MYNKVEYQQYDNSLKALFGNEVAEILPLLLPGAELIEERNIEIDRSKLKADLVYCIKRNGLPHILNLELQTEADEAMHLRLLQYHVGLLVKHNLPVISMMYPFEVEVPTSPFEEKSGEEVLLSLRYYVLCLWEEEAQRYLDSHAVCLYTLLPAMKGASMSLLLRAVREMVGHYSKDELKHHLIRFYRVMQKSKTMSSQTKQQVKEALDMQLGRDWFIDTMPEVIERIAKGKAQGEILASQRIVLDAVQNRFPSLLTLAQEKVAFILDLPILRRLVGEIYQAPDAEVAQQAIMKAAQAKKRSKKDQ